MDKPHHRRTDEYPSAREAWVRQQLAGRGGGRTEEDPRMFQLIKDVDDQKTAQEAMAQTIVTLQAQAAEVSDLLRQVNETIARAPIPATYAVTVSKDRTVHVSGRDALEFVCAVLVAADTRAAKLKLADASTIEVDVGDLEQVCRQIAAQLAGGK